MTKYVCKSRAQSDENGENEEEVTLTPHPRMAFLPTSMTVVGWRSLVVVAHKVSGSYRALLSYDIIAPSWVVVYFAQKEANNKDMLFNKMIPHRPLVMSGKLHVYFHREYTPV